MVRRITKRPAADGSCRGLRGTLPKTSASPSRACSECATSTMRQSSKRRAAASTDQDTGAESFRKVEGILVPNNEAWAQFYRGEIDDSVMARIKEASRQNLVDLGGDVVLAALQQQGRYSRNRSREHHQAYPNIIRMCARVTGVRLGQDVELPNGQMTVWHEGRKQIIEDIVAAVRQP